LLRRAHPSITVTRIGFTSCCAVGIKIGARQALTN
jgi:hypothetical protein